MSGSKAWILVTGDPARKVTLNHFPGALGIKLVKGLQGCLDPEFKGRDWICCQNLAQHSILPSIESYSDKGAHPKEQRCGLGRGLLTFLGLALLKTLLSQKNPCMVSERKDYCFTVFHKIWVLLLALIPDSMCGGQTPTLTPQNRTFGLPGGCGLDPGLTVMTGQLSRSEV